MLTKQVYVVPVVCIDAKGSTIMQMQLSKEAYDKIRDLSTATSFLTITTKGVIVKCKSDSNVTDLCALHNDQFFYE